MPRIRSLGAHEPVGLHVLIAERYLPPNPPSDAYTWHIYGNEDEQGSEDELVIVPECVVWSQGNAVRRIFRFGSDRIAHALLTHFPADDDVPAHPQHHAHAKSSSHRKGRNSGSQALVVILKHQLQAYFLDGSSEVVSLPFEVDRAFAIPRGVIIQRKLSDTQDVAPTPVIPSAPPNSFFSSQLSAGPSFQPRHQPAGRRSRLSDQPPSSSLFGNFSTHQHGNMPRIFVLSRPTFDLGLVVEAPDSSTSPPTAESLDVPSDHEEVIFTDCTPKSAQPNGSIPITVVITANHHLQRYTIWTGLHTPDHTVPLQNAPIKKSRHSLRHSLRRSSVHTRLSTGATTPTVRHADTLNEPFTTRAGTQGPSTLAHPSDHDPTDTYLLDAAEEDLKPGLPATSVRRRSMRSNRRTSSMIARSELSSQEQSVLGDMARNPAIPSSSFGPFGNARQSFGPTHDRTSFGKSRMSGRASTPGSLSLLSDVEEVTSTDDGVDGSVLTQVMHPKSMQAPGAVGGLKKNYTLVRACSIPFGDLAGSGCLPGPGAETRFCFNAPRLFELKNRYSTNAAVFFMHYPSHAAFKITLRVHSRQDHIHRTGDRHSKRQQQDISPLLSSHFEISCFDEALSDIVTVQDHGKRAIIGLRLVNKTPLAVPLEHDLENLAFPIKANESTASQPKRVPRTMNAPVQVPIDFSTLSTPSGHYSSLGRLTLCPSKGANQRFQVRLMPRDPAVASAIYCIDHCVGKFAGFDAGAFWFALCWGQTNLDNETELQAMEITICSLFLSLLSGAERSMTRTPFAVPDIWQASQESNIALNFTTARVTLNQRGHSTRDCVAVEDFMFDTSFSEALRRLLLHLHCLWAEEIVGPWQAKNSRSGSVGRILAVFARHCGSGDWSRYLSARDEVANSAISSLDQDGRLSLVSREAEAYMKAIFGLSQSICSHPISTVAQPHRAEMHEYVRYARERLGSVSYFECLFSALELVSSSGYLVEDSDLWKSQMALQRIQSADAMQSESVSWLLHELLQRHLSGSDASKSTEKATRLGRHNLLTSLDPNVAMTDDPPAISSPLLEAHSMEAICRQDETTPPAASLRTDENASLLRCIFREDRRWHEAAKLVDPLRVAVTTILPDEGMTEAAFLDAQKERAQLVYQRTMSLPSAQAIMRFSTLKPVLTERIKMNTFNTTCSMQPSNNSVNADRSNFTEEKVGWAFFHAGVNAGLHISAEATGIDTSWIVLNKPSELGNRHAGFLLALGLNGHLKKMAKWLSFKYLTAKHTMTSVGLLLGLAASNLGTMDSLITRLLSVHVSRLLPPGAAELNLSPLTQTAGLMSVGLLYFSSQHRRMSEVMLSEIEHVEVDDTSNHVQDAVRDEGYRLAAGFAVGLINIGKGRDLHAVQDLRIVERLLAVATGPKGVGTVHVLDQAGAGATMAIAMIFMKTHDKSIAQEIDIPSTIHQFDSVRPDILLLRTVARWLIMWDDIEPSVDWIKRHSPREWRKVHSTSGLDHVALDSTIIPFYNIVAGLCWVISLRFAGSNCMEALDVLKHYYELVSSILAINGQEDTYDRSLTRDTLLRWQHILALSMATVCAGTGNLEVLRVLRRMHGSVTDKTFGFHQATHMAIGLLFMGHGRYTFGTSDLSIAAIIMSLYPVFPKDILDNRAHLQALRHFWVFAAEPRCLIPRDVETREPVLVPVEISSCEQPNGELKVVVRDAPCLLPELDKVTRVAVASPDYYPAVLEFKDIPEHLVAFKKHQTLLLKRRPLILQQPSVLGATLAVTSARNTSVDRLHGPELVFQSTNEWLFKLAAFTELSVNGEVAELLPRRRIADDRAVRHELGTEHAARALLDMNTTALDSLLVLAADAESDDRSKLMGLRFVLGEGKQLLEQSGGDHAQALWLRSEWVDALRAKVVARASRAVATGAERRDERHDEMNLDE